MSKWANKLDLCKYVTKLREDKVKCNLCEKELSVLNGNTSTARKHLIARHSGVFTDPSSTTPPKLGTFGIAHGRPCTESRVELIIWLIVDLVVNNMLPTSTVDSRALIKPMAMPEPNYKDPCHQTITAHTEQRMRELEDQLHQTTKEHTPALAVTSDIWAAQTTHAVCLGVTASYVMTDWNMVTPILATVQPQHRTHRNEVGRDVGCLEHHRDRERVCSRQPRQY